MRQYKIIWLLLLVPLAWACEKITHGYLSDDVFYQVNPFYVQQGITTTSSSLVTNGSTDPLNVKLLGITNAATGASADSMFLKPQVMRTYTDAVTYADSTLDALNAKLKDSSVAPFSVNSIGGRMQFTQSSLFLDTGTYSMDIQISNVRGSKTLKNACSIVVIPVSTVDTVLYQAWTTSDSAGNFYGISGGLNLGVQYIPGGPDKIVFEWLDKNGNRFNPSAGEVHGRVGRPEFHNWDPYYPEVATDTSLEFAYPDGIPQLPAYPTTVIAGGSSWNGGITYFQVDRHYTDIKQNVNTVSTIQFLVTKGTYIVTYYLSNVSRVP